MRKYIFILLAINSFIAPAQNVIRMNLNQPSPLAAHAGKDTLVCRSHPVTLGGVPTATGGTGQYSYLWSPAEGLDNPTDPNPVATIDETRLYMVSVTDGQGCLAVSYVEVRVDQCLGIAGADLSEKLVIYPNPSGGVFRIRGSVLPGHDLLRIELTGQPGQVLFFTEPHGQAFNEDIELDTRIREAGVYFLRFIFRDAIVTRKVIIR